MNDPAQGLTPQALGAFWTWWMSSKDRVAAAIAERSLAGSPVVEEISAAVHALHPGLAWELGPGRASRHNLTVTPEGNLVLRRLTAQWLASAPVPDQTWEYYASRQPSSVMTLDIGGKLFAPDEFRVAYAFDDSRERFDVQLFHPRFKKSDANLVRQALFLALDECLGEDDVERWIGSLEPATSVPGNAIALADFVSAVARATARRGALHPRTGSLPRRTPRLHHRQRGPEADRPPQSRLLPRDRDRSARA